MAKNEENGRKSLRVPSISSYCCKYFRHKFTILYAFEEKKHVAIQNGVKLTGIQKLDFCQIQWAKITALSQPVLYECRLLNLIITFII